MANAVMTVQFIRLLARSRPILYELIDPHGPLQVLAGGGGASNRSEEVSLNPQPLPPREVLRLAVLHTARGVAEATIAAQMAGRDAGEVLHEVGDDWCPTPPTPKIPWPRHWPFPWPPGEPYPIDPELAIPAIQAEAGLVFAAYAAGIADERLSTAFSDLADRLVDTALQAPANG